jgi:RHS repeat-associated protein
MVTLAANDNGSVAADAVRFVGGPGGATEIVYLHSDHLGTPQAMTDANAQVLWWRDQTPFGQTVAEGGFSVSPLRFPGQYADAESGLNYNYFRDYDPALGRYIQSDPIGLRGGLNTYGYVGGNPLNRTDPFGLVEFFTYELNGEETSNLRCECGETFQAFSGAAGEPRNNPAFANSKDKGPLPKGRYYIVDRPTGGRLGWAYAWFRGDWFGLYRDDGIFDDYTNIDGVIRGNFRLHPGGRSEGCLTLVNDEQFELLRQLLENTEPGFIPSAGNIPYYGIVDVISPGTQVMPEGL